MLSAEAMINLNEGLVVMFVGMGVVFSFLTIMVFAMMIMAPIMKYLNKVFPEKVVVALDKPKKSNASADDEIAVAIAIAVARS